MNVNDYVEITGLVPKELKTKKNKKGKLLKRPFYGQIKSISKGIAVVKPRYQRFTVEVNMTQLTVVDYEKFNKPQKKKRKAAKPKPKPNKPEAIKKKPVLKKDAHKPVQQSGDVKVVGKGPVKVEPIPGKETAKDIVAEKIKDADKRCDTSKSIMDPVPPIPRPVIKQEPPKFEKPAPKEETDPINEKELIVEHQESGGVIIYVVIGLLIIAAGLAYYFFS